MYSTILPPGCIFASFFHFTTPDSSHQYYTKQFTYAVFLLAGRPFSIYFIILCIIQPLPYRSLRSYTWESQQSYSSPSGLLVIGLIRSCIALHNPTCMVMLGYVPHLYYLFEDYVLTSSSFGVWDFSLLFFVELLSLFLPRLI